MNGGVKLVISESVMTKTPERIKEIKKMMAEKCVREELLSFSTAEDKAIIDLLAALEDANRRETKFKNDIEDLLRKYGA
ncbi:hypothetical protein MHH52_21910 [Paenibacillus sp. FSL K6-0276]|uniref:hypothetical protein n=1 Tax=Paenibacillus sp. FSL K6-0276 TaxID=2921450 RepID=UPI0030EC9A6C